MIKTLMLKGALEVIFPEKNTHGSHNTTKAFTVNNSICIISLGAQNLHSGLITVLEWRISSGEDNYFF